MTENELSDEFKGAAIAIHEKLRPDLPVNFDVVKLKNGIHRS